MVDTRRTKMNIDIVILSKAPVVVLTMLTLTRGAGIAVIRLFCTNGGMALRIESSAPELVRSRRLADSYHV